MLAHLVLELFLDFLGRVTGDLLVVLLQSSQVLASLGELTLLHTLAHVPVHKRALGVHEVKLVVQPTPSLGDGRGVGQHADGAVNGSQGALRGLHRLLVVDAQLETSRTPLNQVESRLGLERRDSSATVTRRDITAVKQSHGHVLAIPGVTDHHLVIRLKAY